MLNKLPWNSKYTYCTLLETINIIISQLLRVGSSRATYTDRQFSPRLPRVKLPARARRIHFQDAPLRWLVNGAITRRGVYGSGVIWVSSQCGRDKVEVNRLDDFISEVTFRQINTGQFYLSWGKTHRGMTTRGLTRDFLGDCLPLKGSDPGHPVPSITNSHPVWFLHPGECQEIKSISLLSPKWLKRIIIIQGDLQLVAYSGKDKQLKEPNGRVPLSQ